MGGEQLKAELKIRLTTEQSLALKRVTAREGIMNMSTLARSVLQKYLMEHDEEFRRSIENPAALTPQPRRQRKDDVALAAEDPAKYGRKKTA